MQDAAFGLPTADGLWRQYPFDFRFGKRCHDQKPHSELIVARTCSASIPSSLEVAGEERKGEWKDISATSCRVKYEIQAWTFHGNEVKAAIAQEIRLFDSACVAPPPMIMADFPGEFTLRQEKKFVKAMMKHAGKMTIAVSEPAAADIRRGGDLVQSRLPLRVELRDPKALPSRLELRVKSTLQGSTFISSEKMQDMPSRQLLLKSRAIQEVKTKARCFTQKLDIGCRWQLDPKGTWWQVTTIPLPLVANQTPPPTFTSMLVARRYSVSLQIEVAGIGNATFDLRIPIQMMYSADVNGMSALQNGLRNISVEDMANAMESLGLQLTPPLEALPQYVR